MNINKNYLLFIAEDTNLSIGIVERYYNLLKDIPCVCFGTEEQLLNCLCLYIYNRKNYPDIKDTSYLLSDALYKTYYELSIPYLTFDYLDSLQNNVIQKNL